MNVVGHNHEGMQNHEGIQTCVRGVTALYWMASTTMSAMAGCPR
jgi:hypothetical protein